MVWSLSLFGRLYCGVDAVVEIDMELDAEALDSETGAFGTVEMDREMGVEVDVMASGCDSGVLGTVEVDGDKVGECERVRAWDVP
jgi:hypothetical protein